MSIKTHEAIREARLMGEQIRNKYHTKKDSWVDVEKIAKKLGITVISGKFSVKDGKQVSGILKIDKEKGESIIAIQSGESEVRQRFTIAHEIGHFLLHKDNLYIDHKKSEMMTLMFRDEVSSGATSLKEIQANQFAAELLMPSDEIRSAIKNANFSGSDDEDILSLIKELAKRYQVSTTAMAIKIGKLSE
jgi:Zn-dependent peptidase ImmA (M78 family)